MVGIKDVARDAGVSVGTVSNVINRPDSVSEDTRARADGDRAARLRPQRVRSPTARRAQPHHGLCSCSTWATRSSSTSRAAPNAPPATPGSASWCATATRTPSEESEYLALFAEQRVRGVLLTPADAKRPHHRRPSAATASRSCSSTGSARPGHRMLGVGGRRRGRHARGAPSGRGRTSRRRPTSADRSICNRCATVATACWPRWRRPACRPGALHEMPDRAPRRRRGPGRRRPAARSPQPPHRGVLRQRPARPRGAAVDVRGRRQCARRHGHRRLRRHRVRGGRDGTADLGAAARRDDGRHRGRDCCSRRPARAEQPPAPAGRSPAGTGGPRFESDRALTRSR